MSRSDELAQSLGNMDLLSQTQTAIDDLLQIAASTIQHLSTKSGFEPLNDAIPVTQQSSLTDKDLDKHRGEMAADFVRKAKQIEHLINALPSSNATAPATASAASAGVGEQVEEDEELVRAIAERKTANEEFRLAARVAVQGRDAAQQALKKML